MKTIAAGGFKDITRIASSSPAMWQQICLTNKDHILTLLDSYTSIMEQIRNKIQSSDKEGLYRFFDQARTYRDSFPDASGGPIKRTYSVHIEIADEPGALAAIATILALNQISIKNIGITHNREVAEGSLLIEVWDEKDIARAQEVLSAKGYMVRVRK